MKCSPDATYLFRWESQYAGWLWVGCATVSAGNMQLQRHYFIPAMRADDV